MQNFECCGTQQMCISHLPSACIIQHQAHPNFLCCSKPSWGILWYQTSHPPNDTVLIECKGMQIGNYYGHYEKCLCLLQAQSYCPQSYCFWNTGTGDQYLYVVHCVHVLIHINRSIWSWSGWKEMLSSQKINRHWSLLKMLLYKYSIWARLWHIAGYRVLWYTVSQWVQDKFIL